MSVQEQSSTGGQTAPGATAPGGGTATTFESDRPAPGASQAHAGGGTTTMFEVIGSFGNTAIMGPDANEYLEKIKSEFKRLTQGLNMVVSIEQLQRPNGAFAVKSGNAAVIMIFSDMVAAPSMPMHAPKSRNIDVAMQALNRAHPDIRIMAAVMVGSADFSQYQHMANYLVNTLRVADTQNMSGFNSQLIANGTQYAVDCNVDTAREYIRRLYPHAALPRMDIGMVVYLRRPRNDAFVKEGVEEQDIPLLAVGAYTEMVRQDHQGQVLYLPVVRVTNISTAFPIPIMPMIGMYLAAEQFCLNNRWRDQFRNFGAGRKSASSGANLGNLTLDAEGKLFNCRTQEELDAVANSHCLPAMLALDIVEGLARLPGIQAFSDSSGEGLRQIERYLERFFNLPTVQLGAPLHYAAKDEFIGYFGDEPGTDTRYITYLDAIARGIAPTDVQQLLYWTGTGPAANCEARADLVSKIVGEFRSMFLAKTVILHPTVLSRIGEIIKGAGIHITSNTVTPTITQMAGLMDQTAQMLTLPRVTTAPGNPNAWNGYTNIAGYNTTM